MKKYNIVPFEKIKKATRGDIEEINWIVNFYTPYIKTLATIECRSEDGKVYYVVDDEIFNRVKIKLIQKILKFNPSPFKKNKGEECVC